MDFSVKILGSASALPDIDRSQSAQVLSVQGRLFLIDCGEGTQRQMLRYKVPLMKIDTICISHIHGDHVFGIFGILSTMGMRGRIKPLSIYAPNSFGPILKFFLSYYGDGLNFNINFVALKNKDLELVYSTKKLELLTFPLNHKIDTYGFLIREKTPAYNVKKEAVSKFNLNLEEIGTLKRGEDVIREKEVILAEDYAYMPYQPRSYAYCSDTYIFDKQREWLNGLSILYHETTFLKQYEDQAKLRHHSTTHQAALLAKECGVGRLLIGHYSSRCNDEKLYQAECREIFAETYAVNDGDEFFVE